MKIKRHLESELGDHGVRKVDYELGRFTTIDPLWEKYYAWSPYQYSMNNPVSLADWNGGVVQALDDKSREHIRNSVEVEYRDIVAFKDNGTVYLTEQPKVAPPIKDGDDVYTSNIGALNYLIGVEDVITVEELPLGHTTAGYRDPKTGEEEKGGTYLNYDRGYSRNGMALTPDVSKDSKPRVYIAEEQSKDHNRFSGVPTFGSTAAHELYGHMFRYYFGVSYGHGPVSKKAIIRAENKSKGRPDETLDPLPEEDK